MRRRSSAGYGGLGSKVSGESSVGRRVWTLGRLTPPGERVAAETEGGGARGRGRGAGAVEWEVGILLDDQG